jgi:hypothetical protein
MSPIAQTAHPAHRTVRLVTALPNPPHIRYDGHMLDWLMRITDRLSLRKKPAKAENSERLCEPVDIEAKTA